MQGVVSSMCQELKVGEIRPRGHVGLVVLGVAKGLDDEMLG